jgi:hypothetical protein
MAGRFYRAPIDPGYGQFGAAIAAGMGQGIQNLQRGQMQQEEQRRYQAMMDRQAEADRLAAQMRDLQMRESGYQVLGREAVSAVPSAMGQPLPEIAIPAPGTIPEGRQPGLDIGAALGGLQGAPAAPSGIASATGEFFGVPQQAQPQAGLTIPGALQGDIEFQTARRAGQTGDAVQIGDREYGYVPGSGRDAQERRHQLAEDHAFKQQVEQEMFNALSADIAYIIENGIDVSNPEVLSRMQRRGLKLEDFQSLDDIEDRLWERFKKTADYKHQMDLQLLDRRISADRQTMTGNRAVAQRENELRGLIREYAVRGVPQDVALQSLRHRAGEVGGIGNLMDLLSGVYEGKVDRPSANIAARSDADATGLIEGDPGWSEVYNEALRRYLGESAQQDLERERQRRGIPNQPVRTTIPDAVQGRAAPAAAQVRPQSTPAAAAPLLTPEQEQFVDYQLSLGRTPAQIRKDLEELRKMGQR